MPGAVFTFHALPLERVTEPFSCDVTKERLQGRAGLLVFKASMYLE